MHVLIYADIQYALRQDELFRKCLRYFYHRRLNIISIFYYFYAHSPAQ